MQKLLRTQHRSHEERGPLAPDRIAAILKGLDEAYPNAECALTHRVARGKTLGGPAHHPSAVQQD